MKKSTIPWAVERNALERALESNTIKGLGSVEAENRLREAGENKITHSKKITFWDILWEEVREPLILMLLVIGVLYSIWGDIGDAIMIICVILTVSLVEVWTEYKAKKNIESLKTLAQPMSWVMRDGKPAEIPTRQSAGSMLISSELQISPSSRSTPCPTLIHRNRFASFAEQLKRLLIHTNHRSGGIIWTRVRLPLQRQTRRFVQVECTNTLLDVA